jgi:SAM-dependent methyltransferase
LTDSQNDKVFISPDMKSLSFDKMELIFDSGGASTETIFRRLEFNRVIQYTKGIGVDIGCGLNKIHSAAIGIDARLGDIDYGYPFAANIKVIKKKEYVELPWFRDHSLDFIFSSHCFEHFSQPDKAVKEAARVLKQGGYLTLILPDTKYYPHIGKEGVNPDHEWDPSPELLLDLFRNVGQFKLIQLDTLHERLNNIILTARDERIKQHYQHLSLNFSFEGVFQKI